MLEELAKTLSLKLSGKLERKEITIEGMAIIIDEFLKLSVQTEDIKAVEEFVKKN